MGPLEPVARSAPADVSASVPAIAPARVDPVRGGAALPCAHRKHPSCWVLSQFATAERVDYVARRLGPGVIRCFPQVRPHLFGGFSYVDSGQKGLRCDAICRSGGSLSTRCGRRAGAPVSYAPSSRHRCSPRRRVVRQALLRRCSLAQSDSPCAPVVHSPPPPASPRSHTRILARQVLLCDRLRLPEEDCLIPIPGPAALCWRRRAARVATTATLTPRRLARAARHAAPPALG